MSNVAQNKPMFQWVKGEKMGVIVKSTGETIQDGNMEFLLFEDGSQCNTQLIGDWIVPINSPSEAAYIPDPVAPPAQRAEPVVASKAEKAKDSNPVHELLRMSKKKATKLQLNIVVDIPSEDLIKVVNDSYKDGSKMIGDYLVSSVDQESVMKQIETILRTKVDEVLKKKRNAKHESIS